ncbi:hypothetical protein HG531_007467 [Fusarium graminearum]|nr:hypothetical protein HG531_007467 [Fusarium graminearum]
MGVEVRNPKGTHHVYLADVWNLGFVDDYDARVTLFGISFLPYLRFLQLVRGLLDLILPPDVSFGNHVFPEQTVMKQIGAFVDIRSLFEQLFGLLHEDNIGIDENGLFKLGC